jgi:hypothetical protein
MNPAPVVLIDAFEVPEGEDESFLEFWERQRAFLSAQEGVWLDAPAPELVSERGFPLRQCRRVAVAAGVPGRHCPTGVPERGLPVSGFTLRCTKSCERTSPDRGQRSGGADTAATEPGLGGMTSGSGIPAALSPSQANTAAGSSSGSTTTRSSCSSTSTPAQPSHRILISSSSHVNIYGTIVLNI